MVWQFATPASTWADCILCYYHNVTDQLQVARIALPDRRYERVVFPGQRILFESPAEAILEIFSSTRTDAIRCHLLRVIEPATAIPTLDLDNP